MPNIYIFIEGDKDEEDWQLEGHLVGDCGSKGVSQLSGLISYPTGAGRMLFIIFTVNIHGQVSSLV